MKKNYRAADLLLHAHRKAVKMVTVTNELYVQHVARVDVSPTMINEFREEIVQDAKTSGLFFFLVFF
jgi:hypothetical protein